MIPLPANDLAPAAPGAPAPTPAISADQRARLAERLQQARQAGREGKAATPPRIKARASASTAPLSHAQERLWFLDQISTEHELYNVYQAVRLRGALDAAALERALDEIVRRHEVFRTNFVRDVLGPVQKINPPAPCAREIVDLTDLPATRRDTELQARLQLAARRPFDLACDSLLRALIVRLEANEHVLLLSMHHIVSDAWTLGVVFRELGVLYDAFAAGRPSPLPKLPLRYADYALWERETQKDAALEKPLAYWRGQLAGAEPLELLTDHPRSVAGSARGATLTHPLPAELARELRTLSQREGATLFTTLLAGFQTLLHRQTGQDDIVVGSCVAGRPLVELESLAGFFVNTLVLRTNAGGHPSFRELLQRTRETVLSAMAHQELPFEKVVAELQPDRSPVRNPFFQVMFVLQSAAGRQAASESLQFEPVAVDNGTAKFDLTFSLQEQADGSIAVSLEYRADLYAPETIERLLNHYHRLLAGAVLDPDKPVTQLALLSKADREQLVGEWAGRPTPFPDRMTVTQAFRDQVARLPDAIALRFDTGVLSYRLLDERSDCLARHLRDRGMVPGSLVALCIERSPDLVITLLAILKAGGAYVSLDPTYPAARLAAIMDDTRAAVLVMQEKHRPLMEGVLAACPANLARPEIVHLERDRAAIAACAGKFADAGATADALAYVSYTSGSTGRPKGVCIPHRGILRLVRDTDYASFGPDETFLQFAPVAFDASTLELWAPLLNGGSLAIFPPGVPSLAELAEFIRDRGVTSLFLTTGLFNQLEDEHVALFGGVRQVIAGGDVMSPVVAARLRSRWPHLRVINGYGPTENTTFTTACTVTDAPEAHQSIPLGRPIANTTVYVLDPLRQLVPVGVPGELYTGGAGLASGYLGQPVLTAERFVPDPFSSSPEARLYRTGDLVRWRSDGQLEFLGRLDRQIKLRGFRIELGEIEATLARHPAVGQTAVLLDRMPNGARLVAYVAGREGVAPDPGELRTHLAQRLPDYMVPAVFVPVPGIPLNANGKVDRAALPAPEVSPDRAQTPRTPPRDATEDRLAELWSEILGVRQIGVHDSFFALGGHSLSGVQLFSRIEKEFGRRLPLASLFEAPTIAQLAARLDAPEAATPGSSLVILQRHGTRPPVFFCHGAGGGNLWSYARLAPHLGPDQPVYGFETRAMRGGAEFERIEEMAAHYVAEIRSVQPTGPYYLAGYCFGGNVAFEMSRQLEAAGEKVAFLGLLDSAAANSGYQRLPWWQPQFYYRFMVNTGRWISDFLSQSRRDQKRFVRRKGRVFGRKLRGWLRGQPDKDNVEEVIDTERLPEIRLGLWRNHLRALREYHPRPSGVRAVLFSTQGHPFLCSFDPQFGWGPLASAGVDIVPLPGAHEGIFTDPHLRQVSALFRAELQKAQQQHTSFLPAT